MHPAARDASVAALAHDLFGSVRPGDDHDAVDTTRNRFHVWIAALVLERFHMRIDRKDFVSSGLEAVEDQVSDGRLSGATGPERDRQRRNPQHVRVDIDALRAHTARHASGASSSTGLLRRPLRKPPLCNPTRWGWHGPPQRAWWQHSIAATLGRKRREPCAPS